MGIPRELERPPEPRLLIRHFHEFAHLDGKKREYTQETHRSYRNSHRRAHGLNPAGPWLEIYGPGGALGSFKHSKRLVLIEINNKNKQNQTVKNDLSKYLKVG